MTAFRISQASFSPDQLDAVRAAFAASQKTLEPATRRLRGHRITFTAIDTASHTIAYVSLWDDVEAAKQLGELPEMRAAGAELIRLGVKFGPPVINYETLWSIEG